MGVMVYTRRNCKTTVRIIQYYRQQKMRCRLKWIDDSEISRALIVGLLNKTQNGFEDLLAKQSRAYKQIGSDVGNMTTNEMIRYIQDNPSILRVPIIDEGDIVFAGVRSLGL